MMAADVNTPAIKLFDLAHELAEEIVALHDGSSAENVVISGYTLGGMYDGATELLPLIANARFLLDKGFAEAYGKGYKQGLVECAEAADFVKGVLSDLSKPEVLS